MEISHFIAMLPLLIFLVLSLVFYGKGLIHLLTLVYAGILWFGAVANEWEIFIWPICAIVSIIGIILFAFSMRKGDWL